jgi:diguanylate cyclase (GGDEF)-like protein
LLLVAIMALITLGTFFLSYAFVIVSMSALTLVVMPYVFVMGLMRLLSGYPPARYFMLAWTTFIVGIMVYMAKVFGFLPRTFFTEYGFQVGSLIEMVLLSLALGSRVNEIKKRCDTDSLTEIANRRKFDDILEQEFRRAQRHGQPLSLLMIDIDHFKQFNDTHGHSKGDEVLKQVAAQLRTLIRKPMIPFRFGGEEFAVILPRTGEGDAATLAERLRQHIGCGRASGYPIRVSIGLACQKNAFFDCPRDLLAAADQALYDAKDAGRNCVVCFANPGVRSPETQQLQESF